MWWDLPINASDEEKEIAWNRTAQSFGMLSAEFSLDPSFVVH